MLLYVLILTEQAAQTVRRQDANVTCGRGAGTTYPHSLIRIFYIYIIT